MPPSDDTVCSSTGENPAVSRSPIAASIATGRGGTRWFIPPGSPMRSVLHADSDDAAPSPKSGRASSTDASQAPLRANTREGATASVGGRTTGGAVLDCATFGGGETSAGRASLGGGTDFALSGSSLEGDDELTSLVGGASGSGSGGSSSCDAPAPPLASSAANVGCETNNMATTLPAIPSARTPQSSRHPSCALATLALHEDESRPPTAEWATRTGAKQARRDARCARDAARQRARAGTIRARS